MTSRQEETDAPTFNFLHEDGGDRGWEGGQVLVVLQNQGKNQAQSGLDSEHILG